MPLRGNALLRRVRRHRSMTTLYRSSQFEAPITPNIPSRPPVSTGTQAAPPRVVAQLMPARTDLPFGQLIPADGVRLSAFTRGQPTVSAEPRQLSEQFLETPQRPPETPQAPGIAPSVPEAGTPIRPAVESTRPSVSTPPLADQVGKSPTPAVQREPTQSPSPQPRPDLPASATSDFSWISDSEWNRLKQFAEGHQEILARQAETPEMIQRAEQEKVEQEAQRQREAEITRRQELARQGKLPKADISYLSTETAGTTPIATPAGRPTPPLQRSAEDAGERPTPPAPDVLTSPDAERQSTPAPRERVQPAVEATAHEPSTPIQAKATSEVKPVATPPAAPVEPAKRPESPPTSTETPQTTVEAKPVEQVEMPEEVEQPVKQADHIEPAAEPAVSEERHEPEAGGIRRFLDAARSFLRRDEGETPKPTTSEVARPATVQRHEVDEPEEPGPTEPIATETSTIVPTIQRETADIARPQPPRVIAAPEERTEPVVGSAEPPVETPVQQFQPSQREPGEPTTALAQKPSQESPVAETPLSDTTPVPDRPAAPEPATEASPARAPEQPETPPRQAGSTPAAVQRTMEESPGQEISTAAAPQAFPPTDSPAVWGEDQPVTRITSKPPAPTADVEASTPAPPAAKVPATPSAPTIQRETAEPAEIAGAAAIELPPESGYDIDAGDAETLIQPVPLEAAWPVQKTEPPEPSAPPRVAKKPAGPIAQRKPTGIDQTGEHVHETIKDIAPVEATDSSIELITPRRPRPTLPSKTKEALAGIQRELEPTQQDEVAPSMEAARQAEQAPTASELPSPNAPGASEIQRQEQPPTAPPGNLQESTVIDQPADEPAAEILPAAPKPELAGDAVDRQPEATSERPLRVSEPPVTDISPIDSPDKAQAVQRAPDVSAPQTTAPVPGPEPGTQKKPSEPYPVPTPIGDLPSDLWEMLGEKPPAPQTVTETPGARSQTIQRQADTQPQQIVTEVFRAPELQREEATAGPTESAGTSTTEEAAGEGDEKKSEIDVDALAQKVYPEIRRRLAMDWERGRGRFR